MSAQHTQGRLVVGEMSGHSIEIKHTHGDVPGAISLVLARVTARPTWIAEAEANARHLAACWNAFDGVKTETVEDIVKDGTLDAFIRISAKSMKLELQLAAARVQAETADTQMIAWRDQATRNGEALVAARTLLAAALAQAEADHDNNLDCEPIRAFLKGQP